jgi:RND family efflux transporter MFP subunit
MDATVVKKLVEVGTLVAPGTPAFAVADTTTVLAVIGVPDLAVKSFSVGESLPVTSEALPGVEFRGRITRIAPAADLASRIFEIELSIANRDNRLKPGMIASVEVRDNEGAKPTIAVPLTAVVRSTRNPDAYAVCTVQTENGRQVARFRDVKLGLPVGNLVAVTEGLKAGDRIIVEGASLAAEGAQVRVIP